MNSSFLSNATVDGAAMHHAVVELLACRETYPDSPTKVERIDTHISEVFLADQFAYKLKKPVKFNFLDFSTIENRRLACWEELRINRRLAPDVYLDVVPIIKTAGVLRLAATGWLARDQSPTESIIDWVVKMRRLPAEQSLDRLIQRGAVTGPHIEALTRKLLEFYLGSLPLNIKTQDHLQDLERHIIANCEELSRPEYGLDPVIVKRVHAAQLRIVRIFPEIINARVCDGRIIDGHGDLRPEHIYFAPNPVVIDGIEFNAEFRRADVLDELSFFAMECAALGAGELGNRIVASYCNAAQDHPPRALLRFYEIYRACVRSKVGAIRALQNDGAERQRELAKSAAYLSLAGMLSADLGNPLLLVVWGLSGVGKSVVATELARLLGCELLQTDAVRRELFGASNRPAAFNSENYTIENRELVYNELFRRAESMLRNGISVILDGTFLAAQQRAHAATLLPAESIDFLAIQCVCSEEIAENRIRQRLATGNSLSEVRPELIAKQCGTVEPDLQPLPHCIVDTNTSLPETTQQILSQINAMTRHTINRLI